MIEKALIVIIFMYAASFSMLGVQYLADGFGFTMTSISGTPIRDNFLTHTDVDALNTISLNVTNTNATTITDNPVVAAAQIAYQIFQLLTGTYIFNILAILDVPLIFISGLVLIYVILLIRAIIAYLRGI